MYIYICIYIYIYILPTGSAGHRARAPLREEEHVGRVPVRHYYYYMSCYYYYYYYY